MSTARKLHLDEAVASDDVSTFLVALKHVASGRLQRNDVPDELLLATPALREALDAVAELRNNYDELFRSAEQWAVPAPVAKEAQVKALDLIERLNLGYVRGRIVQIMLLLPGVGAQVKAALLNEVSELTMHLARKDP